MSTSSVPGGLLAGEEPPFPRVVGAKRRVFGIRTPENSRACPWALSPTLRGPRLGCFLLGKVAGVVSLASVFSPLAEPLSLLRVKLAPERSTRGYAARRSRPVRVEKGALFVAEDLVGSTGSSGLRSGSQRGSRAVGLRLVLASLFREERPCLPRSWGRERTRKTSATVPSGFGLLPGGNPVVFVAKKSGLALEERRARSR